MSEPRTLHNFVAAATPDQVTIEPARADLMRRQDVVHTVDRLITAYSDQQSALLAQVQQDATGGGFLSNAHQVDARRRLSRMYLLHQTAVTGMVAAGVVGIAYIAGVVDGGGAFVGWLALTGITALALSTAMHRQEVQHSPEGIAHALITAHWDVASYESETRRLAIEWEHGAEARRQAAQERAAEYARQQAQLRIDELDARRKAIEAQRAQADPYEGRYHTESPQTEGTEVISELITTPAATEVIRANRHPDCDMSGHWRDSLLVWLATLYQPGVVTEAGVIRSMVPWSARSSWTEQDKAEARRVMCELRPALIVHDGNRWRLRTEVISDVDQALQVVRQRL